MSAFLEGVRNRIFPLGIPLSWLQLIGERKRFFAAIAGVTFAVTLMMYQMGIYVAIFEKVVYPHRAMRGDLVMTQPRLQQPLFQQPVHHPAARTGAQH